MTIETMSDADLVQAVIGARKPERAYAVLEQCGGLRGLARAGLGSLAEATSTGDAQRLTAAIELGRRCIEAAGMPVSVKLPNCEAVEAWARPRLATIDHEELWVLCLDGTHGLRAAVRVASGGIHGLHIGARDVLRAAVKEAASAFVLVHNHPSGDPRPSDEDVAFTQVVVEASRIVGTPLLDHVIVSRRRSSSMLDLGLLTRPVARVAVGPSVDEAGR